MLNSPGMVSALDAIMGKDWAVVPFIHSAFGGSGSNDQTWCVSQVCCQGVALDLFCRVYVSLQAQGRQRPLQRSQDEAPPARAA